MIRLEINIGTTAMPDWQQVWMPEDASINMSHVNPVFDTSAGGAFSEQFEFDCEMNRHIIGNADQLHGRSIYKALYRKEFRLMADDVPMIRGIVRLDNEVEIDDGVISIELAAANKEFHDLLEDKSLHDLTIKDKQGNPIMIGYGTPEGTEPCLTGHFKFTRYKNIRKQDGYWYTSVNYKTKDEFLASGEPYDIPMTDSPSTKIVKEGDGYKISTGGIAVPKILYNRGSYLNQDYTTGSFDYINTHHPYEPKTWGHPYCNIRRCYQKYQRKSGEDEWEKVRGYDVMEPQEFNSAPCFYLMYVLDLVMDAINVSVTQNALHKDNDILRMAIVHSNVAYTYRDAQGNKLPIPKSAHADVQIMQNMENVVLNTGIIKASDRIAGEITYIFHANGRNACLNGVFVDGANGNYDFIACQPNNTVATNDDEQSAYLELEMPSHPAFAAVENLPDTSFSDFVDAIQNAFGARFLYDAETKTLEVKQVRDILKANTIDGGEIPAIVSKVSKTENHITGFRMKYSASSDYKANAITGRLSLSTGADDTTYNYLDYRNVVEFGADPSTTDYAIPSNYKDMLTRITDSNMCCYIDPLTGNAYRVKVDSDAKTAGEWFPSLFEVGAFRDVIIGDCSDSSRTEEVSIGFSPVLLNDVNCKDLYKEAMGDTAHTNVRPKYALLLGDAEIHTATDADGLGVRHDYEYSDMTFGVYAVAYTNLFSSDNNNGYTPQVLSRPLAMASFTLRTTMHRQYDIMSDSGPFDGDTPFAVGIMQGSGSTGGTVYYNTNFDREGTTMWTQTAGSDAEISADSCDTLGNPYDWNGADDGLGHEHGLSLKLKAEKPYQGGYIFEDETGKEYVQTDWLTDTRQDGKQAYYSITQNAKRGLFDRYYTEYADWKLNSKVAVFDIAEISLATLMNLDFTKMYTLYGITGFLKQYSYTIDMKTGLSNVKIEMYYM